MATSNSRDKDHLKNQNIKDMPEHISAVQALVQGCVNVELFTIPLYMTSLYSITGLHEINSNNALYKGRIWPGSAPVAKPGCSPNACNDDAPGSKNKQSNERAYNTIYSVFIDEMLHLQLAANIASTIGVAPIFTSPLLQSKNAGWICYGDDLTVIPHILDLRDTINYKNVKVKLGPVDNNQLELFRAIEEPSERAVHEVSAEDYRKHSQIAKGKSKKYFPEVPFKGWKVNWDETKLPMFGSIGYMYQCLKDYLSIEYINEDGGEKYTLWQQLYNPAAQQRDLFNKVENGHPYKEYPGFDTEIGAYNEPDAQLNALKARDKAFSMIDAICDQGEGATPDKQVYYVAKYINRLMKEIQNNSAKPGKKTAGMENTFDLAHFQKYRSEGFNVAKALRGLVKSVRPEQSKEDYGKMDSQSLMGLFRQALEKDLGEVYREVEQYIKKIEDGVKDIYRPDRLALEKDYPSYNAKGDQQYNQSSHAGARCGPFGGDITHYERFKTVLDDLKNIDTWDKWHEAGASWTKFDLITDEYQPGGVLPDPKDIANALNNLKNKDKDDANFILFSQAAAGSIAGITRVLDRYWADPTINFPFPSMSGSGDRVSICWAVFGRAPDLSLGIEEVQSGKMYHACQGLSYTGETDNGCASKQIYHSCKGSNQCKGQGGCGFVHSTTSGGNCGSSGSSSDELFTAPGNNFCGNPNGGYGGCAVPISASQLYPNSGTMQVNKFTGPGCQFEDIHENITFSKGEAVYDVAWKAYTKSLEASGKEVPASPPAVSDLRLAFPPST